MNYYHTRPVEKIYDIDGTILELKPIESEECVSFACEDGNLVIWPHYKQIEFKGDPKKFALSFAKMAADIDNRTTFFIDAFTVTLKDGIKYNWDNQDNTIIEFVNEFNRIWFNVLLLK